MNLTKKSIDFNGGEKNMDKRLIAITLLIACMFASTAFAAINVTADVGNDSPIVEAIQICDGTCANTKTVDPATQLSIKATITDPNGQSDLNLSALHLEIYKLTDSNGTTPNWDHITLNEVAHGTRDGCTETGNTYCLHVASGDWTTKFLSGTANIYVRASDNSGATDSNESIASLTVNPVVGIQQDATSGTYNGSPNTTANAILTDQSKAYIITTHNGNTNIDVSITATDLNKNPDYIPLANQKWNTTNTYGTATPFTGGSDIVKTNFGRGTDPTSATQNIYLWLDVPTLQPIGAYTGTLTYGSIAS